jgi:5-methylcytosine-specific restriction endonuclease McrA
MPRSPEGLCLDCSSRVIPGTKYCQQHQHTNNRRTTRITFDQFRADDEVRKLYRTARWKAVRQAVFKRDGYLCRSCGFRAATECDHTPRARVIIDTFGRNEFFAMSRLTSLCSGCHKSKTRHELGFARGGTNLTKDDLGDRSRTTVVCGQAASGKTTYVEQNKAANDLTWDYDVVMSELTGLPLHESLPEAIGCVLANRDSWIQATRYTPHPCWLIVSNPKAVIVELMKDAGATIITMDTPDEVCQRRLRERYMKS